MTQALPLASTATPPGRWMSPPGSSGDCVAIPVATASSPTASVSVNHSMPVTPGEITVGPGRPVAPLGSVIVPARGDPADLAAA